MMYLKRMMVIATLVSLSAPSYAFDYSGSQPILVPPGYVGEVWVRALVETAQEARCGVRCQCRKVLHSYNRPVTGHALIACEREVASVNNRSLESLNRLTVGESIVIPLTRSQAQDPKWRVSPCGPVVGARNNEVSRDGVTYNTMLSQKNAVALAALQQSFAERRDQTAALRKEVGAVIDSLSEQQKTLAQQQQTLTQLQLYEPKLKELSKQIDRRGAVDTEVLARLTTIEASIGDMRAYVDRKASAPVDRKAPTQTGSSYTARELPPWVWWLFLAFIFIAIVALELWWYLQRRRVRHNVQSD